MVHPDRTVGAGQNKTLPCFGLLESTEEQGKLQKDCGTDQSSDVMLQGGKRGGWTNAEERSGEANIKRIKIEEEVAEEEGGI